MTNKLEDAINRLYNLDRSLSPLALGRQREAAIVDGLNALAAHYGKEIDYTYIDSRGDLKFNIKGADRGEGQYGEELAAQLSKVPTRTGMTAIKSEVMGQNNWLYINHFDAEHLLTLVGKELFDISAEPAPASGPKI